MGNKLMIQVSVDITNGEIEVTGPLDMKPVVCRALAQAIVAVIAHEPAVAKPKNGVQILKPN